MCEQNGEKRKPAAEESKYEVDSLLEIDCEGNLKPLVDFLNLDTGCASFREAVENSGSCEGISVDEMAEFHKELTYVLNELLFLRRWEDSRELLERLGARLTNTRNEVRIVDLKTRQLRIELVGKSPIADLWADIICIFLTRKDWSDRLGRCPECETWLAKTRRDQIYCSDICRSNASYRRNQEKRRKARRERYRKSKRI